ncbi:MAG: hypothetical protein V3W34_06815 [Phycisphaerae bacterium]
MKTERRQELRTNDLGAFLLDVNDWTRKYIGRIGAGAVVVLVALLMMRYHERSQLQSRDSAILAMSGLSFDPAETDASFETLDGLIRDSKDADVRMTALVRSGGAALNAAMGSDGFKPQYLDRAEKAYLELVKAYPDRMPVVGMAMSALATIVENRFVADKDLSHKEVARDYLTKLQNDVRFKGTPFQVDAAERLLHLDEIFQVIALAEPLASAAEQEKQPYISQSIQLGRLDGPSGLESESSKLSATDLVSMPEDTDVGPPLPDSWSDQDSQEPAAEKSPTP